MRRNFDVMKLNSAQVKFHNIKWKGEVRIYCTFDIRLWVAENIGRCNVKAVVIHAWITGDIHFPSVMGDVEQAC